MIVHLKNGSVIQFLAAIIEAKFNQLTAERVKKMQWSALPFSKYEGETLPDGKYEGKTLPEIIVRDLDWFFYMQPKLYGRLGEEAEDLARKARAIKIPKLFGKNVEVEYRFEMGDRFCGFEIV